MRTRATLILLLAFGLVFGWIWFYERKAPTTAKIEALLAHGLQFDPDTVTSIRIRQPAQIIELERDAKTPGGWMIVKPFRDRPDPKLIEDLLKVGAGMEVMEHLPAKELQKSGLQDKDMGLSPELSVEYRFHSGPTMSLGIGSETPTDGIYIRPKLGGKSEDVCVVHSNLRGKLEKTAAQFRDPRLFPFEVKDVRILRVKRAAGELEALRRDERDYWVLEKPLQTRGHRTNIDALLGNLASLEIAIPPEGHGGSVDEMKALKLELIGAKPGQHVQVLIQRPTEPNAKTVLVKITDREGVFQVPAEIVGLLELPINQLRDDILANIDPAIITSVKVRAPGSPEVAMKRQGELWLLEQFGNQDLANTARILQLFKTLNRTKILAFADDSSANLKSFGLDQPAREIELTATPIPGQPPVKSVIRIGFNADHFTFANIEGEPFVYQIEPEALNAASPLIEKWKSQEILRFSILSLREITIAPSVAPPLTLKYSQETATWSARMQDQDLTSRLDTGRVERLAGLLSTFQITDWLTERAPAIHALETPVLKIKIILDTPDGNGGSKPQTSELAFAPAGQGRDQALYYGRLNQSPDVFILHAEIFKALTSGMLRKESGITAPPIGQPEVKPTGIPGFGTPDLPPLAPPPLVPGAK